MSVRNAIEGMNEDKRIILMISIGSKLTNKFQLFTQQK